MSRVDEAAAVLVDFLSVNPDVDASASTRQLQAVVRKASAHPRNFEDQSGLQFLAELDEGVFEKVVQKARQFAHRPATAVAMCDSFNGIESAQRIPNLPVLAENSANQASRAATFATAGGLAAYAVVPALTLTSRAGNADELMATSFALAVALFSSITRSPAACDGHSTYQNIYEVGKGTVGGAVLGLSAAALTPAALLTVVDGGITAGCMLLGGIATHLYRISKKRKLCPGLRGKRHAGNCSQKVCRECYSLFVPDENMRNLDCRTKKFLNSYEVASYLHFQGLSYLDAVELAKDHIPDWGPSTTANQEILVKCSKFTAWVNENEEKLAPYIASVRFHSWREADDRLRTQGL